MRKLIIKLIENYQKKISINTVKKCRFLPTCSEYAKICYTEFNFFTASYYTIKRLLKCNPLSKMKIDEPPINYKRHYPTNLK